MNIFLNGKATDLPGDLTIAAFIINDHVDLALLVDADGIHLGQDDLPPEEVRELVGDQMIIGLSTHSPAQARAAEKAGSLGAWLGLGVLPVIIIACVMGLVWSHIRSQRGNQLKPRIAIFFKGVYYRFLYGTYGRPLKMLPEDGTVPLLPKALPFGMCLEAGAWDSDYTVVGLATAFHGNLAYLTLLLTASPKGGCFCYSRELAHRRERKKRERSTQDKSGIPRKPWCAKNLVYQTGNAP